MLKTKQKPYECNTCSNQRIDKKWCKYFHYYEHNHPHKHMCTQNIIHTHT